MSAKNVKTKTSVHTKGHNKLSRKAKKIIRKSLGAVLLITAIIIAAIPADRVSAESGVTAEAYKMYRNREYTGGGRKFENQSAANIVSQNSNISLDAAQYLISSVPIIDFTNPDIKVYTTGDGTYQFAYVDINGDIGSNTRYAVILGYSSGTIVGGQLTIPDTVDAYLKYSATDGGTSGGYCAVSLSNEFLYYRTISDTNADGNGYSFTVMEKEMQDVLGEDGLPTGEQVEVDVEKTYYYYYYPCYYDRRGDWSSLTDGELYYRSVEPDESAGTRAEYTATDRGATDAHKKLSNATVAYIGDQFIESDGDGGWTIYGDPSNGVITIEDYYEEYGVVRGVFANNGNIRNLTVGPNLVGIGSYAFYGCTSLQSISLGNGLNTIGNYAFSGCINMTSVGIDTSSNITAIGSHAFYDCERLTGFTVPINVRVLCDSAFESCFRIGANQSSASTTLDLCAGGQAVALSYIGNNVFKDCTSLVSLTFPETYSENQFSVSNLEGCSSLNSVYVPNNSMAIVPSMDSEGEVVTDFSEFLASVPAEFYFEGNNVSSIHEVCKANAIAFKYIGQDLYEKIIVDTKGTDTTSDDAKLTWQVNSKNELVNFILEGTVEEVVIEDTIGPYSISVLSADCFSGNCDLTKITIPSSIMRIEAGAFAGCHNLHDVIFKSPCNVATIEDGAFDTQECSTNYDSGSDSYTCRVCGDTLATIPELTFTGDVSYSSVPFTYAMNGNNNINNDSQSTAFVTYYSGWPTNLTIKYNPEKQISELIDYPTWANISDQTWFNSFPYMTDGYKNAASTAVSKYMTNHNETATDDVALTENEEAIINSALNIIVPEGVESLGEGIFSGLKSDGTVATDGSGSNIDANLRLESITLNSVKTIDSYAFDFKDKTPRLATVTINRAAEEIQPYSFADNSALRDVYITAGGNNIAEYAFAGNTGLNTFNMSSADAKSIGNYAFSGDTGLTNVTLSSTIDTLGIRPFVGCLAVSEVGFSGSPYFVCDNSIIYSLTDGAKTGIVECLEARGNTAGSSTINNEELTASITSIADEAFEDCTGLGSIDLSRTSITGIPLNGFKNTTKLYSAYIPNTCTRIGKSAFEGSAVQYVEIPSSVRIIDPSSFETGEGKATITFYCENDTTASDYADTYPNIIMSERPAEKGTFTVYFWDKDGNILDTQTVIEGNDAVPPEAPVVEGFTFTGWLPGYTQVSRNLDVVAQYKAIDSEETKWTVNFYDRNDQLLYTVKVDNGADCISPTAPAIDGYTFTGWRPAITNITKDTEVYAQYEKNAAGGGSGGNGSSTASGNGNGTGTTNPTLYTLTVANGSGSGSYVAGASVIVVSNTPATTQEFDKWTTDNTKIKFISSTVSATAFTMPAENATVTATFKAKTGGTGNNVSGGSGSTASGNSSNSNNNNRPSTGTIVDIDKGGISNGQISSATVNGSTDNFIVKITDDSAATEAAYKALQYEYGDMSNIMFSAMDISLYDSTGKTKITDTSSISVIVTMPIPDSLLAYGGNNKVASIVNDKLEKMDVTFKTIEGVPCMTFTASHFSPYTIYVDTTNLSQGVTDTTPKTGDMIHPKWFLSMGMVLVALILFLKKDKIVAPSKVSA